MIRTFLDAGVLIAAIRGRPEQALLALRILEDPEREFVASVFLRLEVLPKALHQRWEFEIVFYERFFERVVAWAEPLDELVRIAEREAAQYGLNALDGLHVAAAQLLVVDELVTTERLHKPIHRPSGVKIVAI